MATFELEDIRGAIALDVSKYKQGLREATSGAEHFTRSAEKSFSGLGSSIGNVLGGATLKIGEWATAAAGLGVAAVVGLGTWAVKLAADAEQARVSFTTMLGSVEKAKALMGEIQGFAAATPFETTELVNATKKLLAFGTAQEQIIPTMRVLGDVSAGLGIPLNELADLYGKARVQGTLMAEDINQLVGRGIPVIQEFAKQMGVSQSQVKELASQGKIGFNNLQEALVSMTGQGGRFAGMMEAQSVTVSGLFSTLKDAVSQNLQRIGESITENFNLRGAISSISEAITIVANFAIPQIDKLLARIGDAGTIGQRAGELLGGAMGTASKGIGYALDVMELFKGSWYALAGVAEVAISGVMAPLTLLIQGIEWTIEKLGGARSEFSKKTFEAMQEGIAHLANEHFAKAGESYKAFWDGQHAKAAGRFFDDMQRQAQMVAASVRSATPQGSDGAGKPAIAGLKIEIPKGPQVDKEVEALKKSLENPIEKFDREMARLKGLRATGRIDDALFQRGADAAKDDLRKFQNHLNGDGSSGGGSGSRGAQFADALRPGSADAVRAQFANQKEDVIGEKQLAKLAEIARTNKEVRDRLNFKAI